MKGSMYNQAKTELFEPGYLLVQRRSMLICKNLLPIIPVREREAWMLADIEVLQAVLNTSINAKKLGLPAKPMLVENISDPKSTLRQAAQKAYAHRPRRHREIDIEELYRELSQKIRLERLQLVPAYKEFVSELTRTLKTLNLIQ